MIFFSHKRGAAYINHGDYNVFMVDWGNLCRPPCYVAAVHNLKPVAKCLAHAFSFLRNSGMPVQNTVCVGHSLGSHICGLMANYLDFRIERIIGKLIIGCCFLFPIDILNVDGAGKQDFLCKLVWQFVTQMIFSTALDPARPLIAPGIVNRLDSGDAKSVQVRCIVPNNHFIYKRLNNNISII